MSFYDNQNGNQTYTGSSHQYNQINYDGTLSDYTITKDASGTITISHPVLGTDTATHIDGFWFHDEQKWYSLNDAIAKSNGGNIQEIGAEGIEDVFDGAEWGNNSYDGNGSEYDQVDYNGAAADYIFTRNTDGTISVDKGNGYTDTLTNIDGFWFHDEQKWYSVDDLTRGSNTNPDHEATQSYADSVYGYEDKKFTFNVLDNDKGEDLKLVSVSHETNALDWQFAERGGHIDFDAEGNVTYKGMKNYYGKDKLVYTFEDKDGKTYQEYVDVDVAAISDAPKTTVSKAYQTTPFGAGSNSPSWPTHIFPHKTKSVDPDFFGIFSDAHDELQQFGNYNDDTANDVDTIKYVKIVGANNSGGIWKYHGNVIDPLNQEYLIPWADIQAGKLTITANHKVYNTYKLEFQLIDSGDTAHYGENATAENHIKYWTPIALDLNGDGKIGVTGETSSYQKDIEAELGRTVEFDIDADGELDTIEWFDGSGDGILVDTSQISPNGEINGAALFGDQGGQYTNGYEKLATFDINGDGQVNGDEATNLAVWIDNGDAVLQDGELVSLSEAGIASVSTELNVTLDTEGRELLQSTATDTDGNTLLTEDVFFAEDTSNPDEKDIASLYSDTPDYVKHEQPIDNRFPILEDFTEVEVL